MPHLKAGDTIAVLALSTSMNACNEQLREFAEQRLTQELGLRIVYGQHARDTGALRNMATVAARIEDLHAAFLDPTIKAIMMFRGGYCLNDILPYVGWDLIREHWKPFIGYSDATVFQLALYAKTGLMSFSGPMFTNFGEQKLFEYTMEYFRRCLFADEPYVIEPSAYWNDDNWPKDQEHRCPILNQGVYAATFGTATGILLGDNLSTLLLNVASGEFMPSLTGSILCLEDDNECQAVWPVFARRLEALTQRPDWNGVRGLVLGRFMKANDTDTVSGVSSAMIIDHIRAHPKLRDLPVIINFNVGHTAPYSTRPIGGRARIVADPDHPTIEVLEH